MIAGLTWPCTLPPGWSVEWDGLSTHADTPSAEWCRIWASLWHLCIASCRTFYLPLNNELWWTVLVKTSVVLYSASPVCNKFKFHCTSLSCKKYYVLYSLGSPSCELLFVSIPVSVALIETLLEELSCSAVFWSELPSNGDYRTQPSLFWVVPPHKTRQRCEDMRMKSWIHCWCAKLNSMR